MNDCFISEAFGGHDKSFVSIRPQTDNFADDAIGRDFHRGESTLGRGRESPSARGHSQRRRCGDALNKVATAELRNHGVKDYADRVD